MQTVTVAARQAFRHDGQDYAPGDSVTLSPLDASILGRRGFVSLLYGDVGMQRKDMTAEPQSAPAVAVAGPEPERPSTPTPPLTRKRRGRYARRDMRAEGGE